MGRRLAQTRPLPRLSAFQSLSHAAQVQLPHRTRLEAVSVLPVQTPLPLRE
jgi:hypothetical protein